MAASKEEGNHMAWTNEDEKLFQELMERRKAERTVLWQCVKRAAHKAMLPNISTIDDITDVLIENAERFRKVLEPFDTSLPNHIKLEN